MTTSRGLPLHIRFDSIAGAPLSIDTEVVMDDGLTAEQLTQQLLERVGSAARSEDFALVLLRAGGVLARDSKLNTCSLVRGDVLMVRPVADAEVVKL